LIAKKLDQVRNFELPAISEEMREQPRLPEVMWFLAFVSRNENYPGGLRKFSTDLIAQSADLIGTCTMLAHGAPPYPEALREAIFNEIPSQHRWDFGLSDDVDIYDFLPYDPDRERERKGRRAQEEKRAPRAAASSFLATPALVRRRPCAHGQP
jgi:hypothetical protein